MGSQVFSGQLDQRIKLFKPTETNVSGQLIITYTEDSEVWAHVISQRGWEAFEAARVNAKEAIRACMRYNSSITVKWVIEWAGQRYSILSVDRSDKRGGLIWFTAQITGAA
jgi:SPP1 family predicted phage head-tail adaptor